MTTKDSKVRQEEEDEEEDEDEEDEENEEDADDDDAEDDVAIRMSFLAPVVKKKRRHESKPA
jgi:hypothetical protein